MGGLLPCMFLDMLAGARPRRHSHLSVASVAAASPCYAAYDTVGNEFLWRCTRPSGFHGPMSSAVLIANVLPPPRAMLWPVAARRHAAFRFDIVSKGDDDDAKKAGTTHHPAQIQLAAFARRNNDPSVTCINNRQPQQQHQQSSTTASTTASTSSINTTTTTASATASMQQQAVKQSRREQCRRHQCKRKQAAKQKTTPSSSSDGLRRCINCDAPRQPSCVRVVTWHGTVAASVKPTIGQCTNFVCVGLEFKNDHLVEPSRSPLSGLGRLRSCCPDVVAEVPTS